MTLQNRQLLTKSFSWGQSARSIQAVVVRTQLSRLQALARRRGIAHTIDVLLDTGKVDGLEATDLLLREASQSRASSSDGTSGASSSDVGALGNARRNQLTSNWRPQGLGESF